MTRLQRLLAVCACLALPAGARATVALRISPALLELELARGEERDLEILVENLGTDEVRGALSVAGLQLSPEGYPLLTHGGAGGRSCESWLTLKATEVTIRPGETEAISARIRAPVNARGGAYGVIAIQTDLGSVSPAKDWNVGVSSTTGTVLVISVKGPSTTRAQLAGVEGSWLEAERQVALGVDVANTGDIHFRCSGQVVVTSAAGRVVFRGALAAGTGTVLPGGTRRFTAAWAPEQLPSGTYRVDARVTVPRHASLRQSGELVVP